MKEKDNIIFYLWSRFQNISIPLNILPFIKKQDVYCLISIKISFFSERNILEGIASEYGLVPKEDLHITVIGNQNGQKIMSILNKKPEHEKDALLEEMHVVAEQTDWSFSLLPTDVYRVERGYAYKDPETKEPKKEHRIAIVQAVSVPGVDSFFKKLNDMLGTEMAPQPMHVTLYTGGTDPERSKKGIGVNSIEEFFALRPAQILV